MTKKKLLKALAVTAIATSLVACSDSSSKDKSAKDAATNSGSSVATTAPVVQGTDTVTKMLAILLVMAWVQLSKLIKM